MFNPDQLCTIEQAREFVSKFLDRLFGRKTRSGESAGDLAATLNNWLMESADESHFLSLERFASDPGSIICVLSTHAKIGNQSLVTRSTGSATTWEKATLEALAALASERRRAVENQTTKTGHFYAE